MATIVKEKGIKDGSIGKMKNIIENGSTSQSPPNRKISHHFDTGKKTKLVAPKSTIEDIEVSINNSIIINEDKSSSTEFLSFSMCTESEKSENFGVLILPRNVDDGDSVMFSLIFMDKETIAEVK